MAVSTGEVFAHDGARAQIWNLGSATAKGTLKIQNGVVGVTLTDTEGVAKPDEVIYGGVKVTGLTRPGASNYKADAIGQYATGVAIDGTWEFKSVAGATTSTAQGAPVFAESDGDLTLTSEGNTRIGTVNYPGTYFKEAGKLPIAIGL